MTLEEAWKLIELLNDWSNKQSTDQYRSGDIKKATEYQSFCFRKNFLNLEVGQRKFIQDWVASDDEFKDYFYCLYGEE